MREYPQWTTIAYIQQEMERDPDFLPCIQALEEIRVVSILPEKCSWSDWVEKSTNGTHETERELLEGLLKEKRIMLPQTLILVGTERFYKATGDLDVATLVYADPHLPYQDYTGAPMVVEGFAEIGETFLRHQYERYHDIPWRVMETERCYIRELALSDIDALFHLYKQPHITDYIEPLFEREKEIEYQQTYIENIYRFYGFGMWLIFDKTDDSLIGRAGIEVKDYPEGAVIELGYIITPERQRQGYATEVCREILRYAREEEGITEVHCLIEPKNKASVFFIQSLGFVEMGKMHMDGQDFEHYIYH